MSSKQAPRLATLPLLARPAGRGRARSRRRHRRRGVSARTTRSPWINDQRHDAAPLRVDRIVGDVRLPAATRSDRRATDRAIRAVNVNTLGEVPDSSWFVNRIGLRDLQPRRTAARSQQVRHGRGVDLGYLDRDQGKGPGGFHPGFRAERPGDPGQVYQLEDRPGGASPARNRRGNRRHARSTTRSAITRRTSIRCACTRRS